VVWIGGTGVAVALTVAAFFGSRLASPRPFQVSDHRLLSDFPGGSGGPSFSPDGNMVAFHRADLDEVGPVGNFQIWVKNVSGGTPLQLTFDEARSVSPCWSPKGDQILFIHRRGIWSVSPLGGTPRRLIEQGWSPRFSADGERIVFEDPSPGSGIWIANADGSQRRQIAQKHATGPPASPALSPDGRAVAFFQSTDGAMGDIWVAALEGGARRRLTFDSSEAGGPVWTPDGRFIVFYSSRNGSQTLWRIPPQGGTPEPVTSGAGQDRDPDISRDGTRLVYSNFRVTRALIVHDPATGQSRELLQRRHRVERPRFSPDGNRIAFSQQADKDLHVFIATVDGRDVHQVTQGAGQQNLAPHWSKDASWLYFVQQRPAMSLRKVAALGGDSIEVGSWSEASVAEVDPFGRSVAYVRMENGEPSTTVVRNLATGRETPLEMLIHAPRWSPDGETLVGWQPVSADGSGPAREPGRSRVVSCGVSRGTCQVLVETGVAPVVASDGRTLFLRTPDTPLGARELWAVRQTGRDPEQISLLRSSLDVSFDVSRRGEIVFVQHRESRAELWQAQLR
jgi:Tol biopolymer transport system component